MKRILTTIVLLALALCVGFTLSACDEKEVPVAGIDYFECDDLTVTEGDTLQLSNAQVYCVKTDGTKSPVSNNLTYDKTSIESSLDEDGVLIEGSGAKSYGIKVYHLEIEICTFNVIVKVKK